MLCFNKKSMKHKDKQAIKKIKYIISAIYKEKWNVPFRLAICQLGCKVSCK